jgi:hypothetical protein
VVYRANVAWSQVHRHYRYRFGIETSYRIKNQARIRSTTKNPVLRLLYVALAFILVNLWVYLLWQVVSATRRGGRQVFQARFPLKTMLSFIRQAVEQHFPLVRAVYLPRAAWVFDLLKLLQYAQKTVDSLQQQRYLEYACSVTEKIQSYPDLYRDYVSSDLSAIQLDQKVTAAALGAGESGDGIAALLLQWLYSRFQQDV